MRALQVGSHVNLIDSDERVFKRDLARDDQAELALEKFVDAFLSMFHDTEVKSLKKVKRVQGEIGFTFVYPFNLLTASSQLLRDLFEHVTLNHVANLIF